MASSMSEDDPIPGPSSGRLDTALKSDVDFIRNLLPDLSVQNVKSALLQHVDHPSRVQIVLSDFTNIPPNTAVRDNVHEETDKVLKRKAETGICDRNNSTSKLETGKENTNSISHDIKVSPEKFRKRNVPKPNKKIELNQSHLHGPFNFSDHRKEGKKCGSLDVNGITGGVADGSRSTNDFKVEERDKLLDLLTDMFPQAPRGYLKQKSGKVVGNDAAIDRLIGYLVGKEGRPSPCHSPHEIIQLDDDLDENFGYSDCIDFDDKSSTVNKSDAKSETPSTSSGAVAAPPHADPEVVEVEPEDKTLTELENLQALFPLADPEFLHSKLQEFGSDARALSEFVEAALEGEAINFPTKADYEKRCEETRLIEKYTREVTVQEILEMYSEPDVYFSDVTRKVSDVYKKHSIAQLKREFRWLTVTAINKAFYANACLFFPSYKKLKMLTKDRKTKRGDYECPLPTQIDLNFLKEFQFARIEHKVREFKETQVTVRQEMVEEGRKAGTLQECQCCFDSDCLSLETMTCRRFGAQSLDVDDKLMNTTPHKFCMECVKRAAHIAIGDGKTSLACLATCDSTFDLTSLQKCLEANVFSKWIRKIQLAEVVEANLDNLERCKFCEFATIVETAKDVNKVFVCLNPECGKETCRLCGEISHLPLNCDEIEKDAEVRKRTFIENKMSEALIRKCWKCNKPFLKSDGCNKMTCECGAKMCYLCRQPVKDYNHFYGQGGSPGASKTCPLWSNNEELHVNEVAEGARHAEQEVETDVTLAGVRLKHDPVAEAVRDAADVQARRNVNNQQQANVVRYGVVMQGGRGQVRPQQHNVNVHQQIIAAHQPYRMGRGGARYEAAIGGALPPPPQPHDAGYLAHWQFAGHFNPAYGHHIYGHRQRQQRAQNPPNNRVYNYGVHAHRPQANQYAPPEVHNVQGVAHHPIRGVRQMGQYLPFHPPQHPNLPQYQNAGGGRYYLPF